MMNGPLFSLLSAKQQELEILKKNVDILFRIIMGNFVFCINIYQFLINKSLLKKLTVRTLNQF